MQAPEPITNEEQLLLLLRNEKTREQGFRQLMTQYQQRLYVHIRRMVNEHQDANDVLQNCLVKVYRNVDKFKGQSTLFTWLYRIATNEAITFLNQRQRRAVNFLSIGENMVAKQVCADPPLDGDVVRSQLQRALAGLPDRQRQVFVMRYYDELSYQEIAEILQTSVGGLKASYHHAVKKIENFLINTMI